MPEASEDKTTEDEDGDHCQGDLDIVKSVVHGIALYCCF